MKPKVILRKKSLLCELTDEEFTGHATELAKLLFESDRIEQRLASMRSAAKAELDVVMAKISLEKQLVQERKEWRDVECVITYDYDTKKVITARKDTGEIVEERGMRYDEMQVEMDLEEVTPGADSDLNGDDQPLTTLECKLRGKKSLTISFRDEAHFMQSVDVMNQLLEVREFVKALWGDEYPERLTRYVEDLLLHQEKNRTGLVDALQAVTRDAGPDVARFYVAAAAEILGQDKDAA